MEKFAPILKDFPHIVHGGDYNPDQWLKHPEILREDIRLMKLAGINNATVAIFAWSALEPQDGVFDFDWLGKIVNELYQNGIYTTLATPSGARPAWMDEKYPSVRRTNEYDQKMKHGRRHNHCMSSPDYRRLVNRMNTKLAEYFKGNPAVKLWHISNEYSGECFCDNCKKRFREFLRKKYNNDIAALNEQWWTAFWSHTYDDFDQIDPPSPLGETAVHGQNLDWKRYVTFETCDFIDNEVSALKKVNPDIPITANLMGTYVGLDYWTLAKHIDVISWDSYPLFGNPCANDYDVATEFSMRHDLMRGLLKKPYFLMESTPSCVNWQTINKPKRPGMHILDSINAIAHGADSIQYFQWRKSRGSSEKFHGAVVDHEGSENTRVFKEVAKLGEQLSKLDEIVGTYTKSDVALMYDWEIRWAIDDFQGYNERRNYEKTVREFYRCFNNSATNVDMISSQSELSGYKLVIAPMMYCVSEKTIDRLEEYVKNGGTLVCTYFTGYVNENDLCYLGGFPGGKLRKLFGVWSEENDALFASERVDNKYVENSLGLNGSFSSFDFCEVIHTEGATPIALYQSQYYAQTPSITVNSYGKGKAYYIATRQSPDDLATLVSAIADSAEVEKILPTKPDAAVKVCSRTDGTNSYIFICNYSDQTKTLDLGDIACEDLLDGTLLSGTITLKPYDTKVARPHHISLPTCD